MSLLEQLSNDLKNAMKRRDKMRIATLRMLTSQLKDERIALRRDLTPEEEAQTLTNAAKKRKEAIEAYEKASRHDLAEKERAELEVISEFLPKQLEREEIIAIIDQAIAETGAAGMKDLGKVMGKIMPQVKGRADGKLIQQLVREKLS